MLESILLLISLSLCGYAVIRLFPQRETHAPDSGTLAGFEAVPQPANGLERFLQRLQFDLGPMVFLAGLCMASVISGLLVLEVLPGQYLLATISAVGLAVLAVMLMFDYIGWRTRRFESNLQDAIDLMNTALKGGLSPRQSLQAAVDAASEPTRGELRNVADRLDLGLPVEQVTRRMRTRYDGESVRLFTQAMVARWNDASGFVNLLSAVGDLVRERAKLRRMVEGQLSGSRYAAIFAGLLPYVLVPVFLWRQPEWLDTLVSHPHGPSFMAGALLLQAIGFVWLRRILRVEL